VVGHLRRALGVGFTCDCYLIWSSVWYQGCRKRDGTLQHPFPSPGILLLTTHRLQLAPVISLDVAGNPVDADIYTMSWVHTRIRLGAPGDLSKVGPLRQALGAGFDLRLMSHMVFRYGTRAVASVTAFFPLGYHLLGDAQGRTINVYLWEL
jgi:hypothetical protein